MHACRPLTPDEVKLVQKTPEKTLLWIYGSGCVVEGYLVIPNRLRRSPIPL